MSSKDLLTKAFILFSVFSGVLIFLVLTISITAVIDGFVIKQLYDWFIFGRFCSVNLSIANAIGINILISLLTKHPDFKKIKGEETDNKKILSHMFLSPAVVLLIGYIVKLFL